MRFIAAYLPSITWVGARFTAPAIDRSVSTYHPGSLSITTFACVWCLVVADEGVCLVADENRWVVTDEGVWVVTDKGGWQASATDESRAR